MYTKWIGNQPYSYGQVKHAAHPLSDELPFIQELMDRINKDTRYGEVDSCFVAYYPSNKACLTLHADNEDNLDHDSSICTVSIGTTAC